MSGQPAYPITRGRTGDVEEALDIQILLICAFLGVCVRVIFGLNPLMLIGTVSVVTLILPTFLISLPGNAEMTHTISNSLDLYLVTLTKALPSMIIGELLGIFAKEILKLPKAMIDHIRALL